MKNKTWLICIILATGALVAGVANDSTSSLLIRANAYLGTATLRWHADNARWYGENIGVTIPGPTTEWQRGYLAGQAAAYDHAADMIEQAQAGALTGPVDAVQRRAAAMTAAPHSPPFPAACGARVVATVRHCTELGHSQSATTGRPAAAVCKTAAAGFAWVVKQSSATASTFLRWLCDELVRSVLWGVWEHVLRREGDAQDRAFRRFNQLVDGMDCWPCRVSWQHPRLNEERHARGERGPWGPSLQILSGAAADGADLWEDWP